MGTQDGHAYASAEELITGDLDLQGQDVHLPSGRAVRVRGLSRFELAVNAKGTEDSMLVEARNVATCLVQPVLTVDQVQHWQRVSSAGGDLRAISEAIRDLSALGQGADKSDPGGAGGSGESEPVV